MNSRPAHESGPLRRLLMAAAVVAAACVVVFLGAIVMAVVFGVGLLLLLAFYLRLWWIRRRLGLDLRPRHPRRTGGSVIEGEYTVERETPADDRRDER
ncbi:MAG TPA: hypothetical protein VFM15_06030 [Gammaproteobacteria bacterium]|nr:hypothetical protein [Gammaproteobacteria bacterium]